MTTHQRFFAAALLGLNSVATIGCISIEDKFEETDTSSLVLDNYRVECDNLTGNFFNVEVHGSTPAQRHDDITACAVLDPGDPSWEAATRAACSAKCLASNQTGTPVCDEQNWGGLDVYSYCTERSADFDLDPVDDELGSDAAEAMASLPCDLQDTCLALLDDDASLALTVAVANPRTTADELKETDYGHVSLAGVGAGMAGTAAYTKVSCTADACPFYLAQLDVAAAGTITVPVTVSGSTLIKTVSGLSVGLERPALGVWIPGTGDVIFPPGSLGLRVTATVGGATNTYGENGLHDNFYPHPDYVFGSLAGTSLSLSTAGTDTLGAWSLALRFVPE